MTKLKIEKMYAFIAKNEEGEGIMAFRAKDVWMPMVSADFKRIESLLPVAKELAKVNSIKFRIMQFDNATDVTKQIKEASLIKAIIQQYIKNNKGATKEEILRYLNEEMKFGIPAIDIDEIMREE